jgi:hypothetical protein
MQNYHNENNIPFNKGNKLIGSYFGKEILSYTPLLKWYLQQGLKLTKENFIVLLNTHLRKVFNNSLMKCQTLEEPEILIKHMN